MFPIPWFPNVRLAAETVSVALPEAAVTVTEAEPDLVVSCVLVAVMVTGLVAGTVAGAV